MRPTRFFLLSLMVMFALSGRGLLADDTGVVRVVHGIPGVTVDVYVNGDLTLEDFEPRTITDPLELPVGDYEIAITLPNDDPTDPDNVVLGGSAALTAGANVSIVAHLDADGGLALSVFGNDVSEIEPGNARVVVTHAAAAPEVDVLLKKFFRKVGLLEGLINGDAEGVDVRAGFYFSKIFPAGSDDAVFGPTGLLLRPGKLHTVFAIGSLEDGTFQLLIQKMDIPEPAATTGFVSILHGVPGLTVDVYVNGDLTLEDFEPGTITDPLELPAGSYDVAITAANGDPASPAIAGTLELEADTNVSAIAHLAADGSPTLSVFENDLTPLWYGRSRLAVRHTAAAPAVDVELTRYRWQVGLIEDLANGEESSLEARSGRYKASIFPAGGDEPVLGPAKLKLRSRRSVAVYAIGSLADENLGLLVQEFKTEKKKRSFFSFLSLFF